MKDDLRKDLLQRRMSRKEFLAILGSSMLVLFGFGRLMNMFQHAQSKSSEASKGFGSRKFGG
jgi:hypothetical protein